MNPNSHVTPDESSTHRKIAANRSLIPETPRGHYRWENDQWWYVIDDSDGMAPFLITLISDRNHWMFLGSNGAIAAGRQNPDQALFPYTTQDKLLDSVAFTGPVTLLRVAGERGETLWQPWQGEALPGSPVRRSLRKNQWGNHLIFTETRTDLGLTIQSSWRPSARFGFVRRVELISQVGHPLELQMLDGLQNLLCHGITERFQTSFSNLGDAYKRSLCLPDEKIGVFHLGSIPTDHAAPMESLLATVVWSHGLPKGIPLLSSSQFAAFRAGRKVEAELEMRGWRHAYAWAGSVTLPPRGRLVWHMCAEIDQSPVELQQLQCFLRQSSVADEVENDCRRTEARLRAMLAASDGLQITRDHARCLRHTSNTTFNLLRGGTFPKGYQLPWADLCRTVAAGHREAARQLANLTLREEEKTCRLGWEATARIPDPDLLRHLREYLPLSFSRRHGDPSRPWNRFHIEVEDARGEPRFTYQGNWRDIFQNWETLLHAWPEYLEAAICRFLNASTADGFNPYRVTKNGFEWEAPNPDDPWAGIGYWGDHQIVYLLRLLEAAEKFHPGYLSRHLAEDTFVYAEVPYRIRDFAQLEKDPRHSIDYDHAWEKRILQRVDSLGEDGKLLHTRDECMVRINLWEKLLAPLLAKLSALVPGGGIWMNTQRPEWNDANNALVGYGVSVVTLGYLSRYVRFLIQHYGPYLASVRIPLSREMDLLWHEQAAVFAHPSAVDDPSARYSTMHSLGQSVSRFRQQYYEEGWSGERVLTDGSALVAFLEQALVWIDLSLLANRRPDGLFHSYNLLHFSAGLASLDHLQEMLEGQVSILSAGILTPQEELSLLRALRSSRLYRADQGSYLLYPDRKLPDFLENNHVASALVHAIPLLHQLHEKGHSSIVAQRPDGDFSFAGTLYNAGALQNALQQLERQPAWTSLVRQDGRAVLELYENVFRHRGFTGRSGSFFAYEGLGSIYWHMVSKLLLAVQECWIRTLDRPLPEEIGGEFRSHYEELKSGLGWNKAPSHYGAFPIDAYSHTPKHSGAQQPGMTGQVKEDILIRLCELGVRVADGCLAFDPRLLSHDEFLQEEETFPWPTPEGGQQWLTVSPGSLFFSFCGTPIMYRLSDSPRLEITHTDGDRQILEGRRLPRELSQSLFRREGKVASIVVHVASKNSPIPTESHS